MTSDRDAVYGTAFRARVRGLGTDLLVAPPRTPQANAFAERVMERSGATASTTLSSAMSAMPSASPTATWVITAAVHTEACECNRRMGVRPENPSVCRFEGLKH